MRHSKCSSAGHRRSSGARGERARAIGRSLRQSTHDSQRATPSTLTCSKKRSSVCGEDPSDSQAGALSTDAVVLARAIARKNLGIYLTLPNYQNNWKWLGFEDADFANGGSDRLIDAVVAWGDEDAIRARIQAHFDAGADHVCIQAFRPDGEPGPDLGLLEALAPKPAARAKAASAAKPKAAKPAARAKARLARKKAAKKSPRKPAPKKKAAKPKPRARKK